MRKEKENVKQFYDAFGWKKNVDGVYNETETWFDRSASTSWYQHLCRIRIKRFLKPSGNYFLDAGSGAVQHREHLEYSFTYRWHVCIDLSITALIQARLKLGERGLYILADLTNLPFKDEIFDSALCSEVLFHVPADEQESAVRELRRVLRHGANCVIIYMWPICLLSTMAEKINNVRRVMGQNIRKISIVRLLKERVKFHHAGQVPVNNRPPAHPPLYCHAHNYQWFQQVFRDWNIDIRSFRSVDESLMASLIPHNWTGQLLLKLVFWCETAWPHLLARVGRYPTIIIDKAMLFVAIHQTFFCKPLEILCVFGKH